MVVAFRAHHLDLVGSLLRHLERRVRAALGPLATRVSSVTLALSDTNGRRGGADLRCVVTVHLVPKGSVRAEATDSDLLSAIGRALARARRAILSDTRRERTVPALGLAAASGRAPAPPDSSPGETSG